jgi:hypothetical protein
MLDMQLHGLLDLVWCTEVYVFDAAAPSWRGPSMGVRFVLFHHEPDPEWDEYVRTRSHIDCACGAGCDDGICTAEELADYDERNYIERMSHGTIGSL